MTYTEWNDKIQELKSFFSNTKLPKEPVKIDNFATIVDIELFVNIQLKAAEENIGNYRFQGAIEKLMRIKGYLERPVATRKYS